MGSVTVGWAAAAAAATGDPTPSPSPDKPGYAVGVVCRPDPHHVILQIVNRTPEDAGFTLRLVGGEEKVEGIVPARDDTLVKVPWTSPHDRWLLRVDHEWLTVKAGEPKDCHKPSHSPSAPPSGSPSASPSASASGSPSGAPSSSGPTEPPDLPTTGADVPTLAGAGLSLIGAGAVALFLARRRRTREN
jgi:LPXTG-motif cell wall-anchored protein